MISAKQARELTRQAIVEEAKMRQGLIQEAMDTLDWRIREASGNKQYRLKIFLNKLWNGFSLLTENNDMPFSSFGDHPDGVPGLSIEAEKVLEKLNAEEFTTTYDPYNGVLEITWPEEE